jgi:hypothetical protein
MSRLIGLLGAACCVLSACAAESDAPNAGSSAETADLSQQLADLTYVSLQNVNATSGSLVAKCMGIDGASQANGALAKQFDCDGRLNQGWRLRSDASTATTIATNANSGKCLGVDRGSTTPGANVGQFNCDGSANQRWVLNAVGGTTESPIVTLINRTPNSGICIGVDRGSTAAGAQLMMFSCDGRANQQWRLIQR